MTRSELINELCKRNKSLEPEVVEKASKIVLDNIIKALADGDRVELRGFGSFSLRHLKPHDARNPKTGGKISVGHRFSIYFRPGKTLKDKLKIEKSKKK